MWTKAYQVLLPVMREGFDRGERIFYIVDPDLRADHLAPLSAALAKNLEKLTAESALSADVKRGSGKQAKRSRRNPGGGKVQEA